MSLEQAKAQIDRENCIANNIDALGKKWVIKHIAHSTLYTVRPDPDREDAQIPKLFQGKYTHPDRAQAKISVHLKNTWDKAEAATKQAASKARVDLTTQGASPEAEAEEEAAIADILGVEETTEE